MMTKVFFIFAILDLCSPAVVTRWPPEELERVYLQFRQERKQSEDFIKDVVEPKRAVLCTQVLNSNYFKDSGIEYVHRDDFASQIQLLRDKPDRYGLYYAVNDPRHGPIYPIVKQNVTISSFQEELFTIPCLGRESKSKQFEEFFISNWFKKHTYSLFRRDPLGNIDFIGLVLLEPGFSKMANQNSLEAFYVNQREKLVSGRSDVIEGHVLRTISPTEKQQLASLLFDSNFFRGIRNGKIDGPAFSMEPELQTKPIKFINSDYSKLNWTADVLIVTCPICVSNTPKSTTKTPTNRPKRYFIGTSYNGRDAAFIFREDEEGDEIILDSYVFGVTVLSKS